MDELIKYLKEIDAYPKTGFGKVNIEVTFTNGKIVHLEVTEKKTSIKPKK